MTRGNIQKKNSEPLRVVCVDVGRNARCPVPTSANMVPPPPAPPPFLWACICLPAAGYTCSNTTDHRAFLTCNGRPYASWRDETRDGDAVKASGLADCHHATGCGADGRCSPRWDVNYRYAALVSRYDMDACEASPPSPPGLPPPSPGPPQGWCEQLQAAASWSPQEQHQPANTLSSLFGAAIGAYQLAGAQTACVHFRVCASWLLSMHAHQPTRRVLVAFAEPEPASAVDCARLTSSPLPALPPRSRGPVWQLLALAARCTTGCQSQASLGRRTSFRWCCSSHHSWRTSCTSSAARCSARGRGRCGERAMSHSRSASAW